MDAVVFLFNWDHPAAGGWYFPLTGAAMEAAGSLPACLPNASLVRTGDLLCDSFTRRIDKVRPAGTHVLGGREYTAGPSWSRVDDRDARYELTVHLFDYILTAGQVPMPQDLWTAMARCTVAATSMNPLTSPAWEHAHRQLTESEPSYLGSSVIDFGCPVSRELFWRLLSPRYLIGPGRAVRIVPEWSLPDDEQWTSIESDMINDFNLENHGWVTAEHRPIVQDLSRSDAETSAFGRQSEELLKIAMRPGRRELLARELLTFFTDGGDAPPGFVFEVLDDDDTMEVKEEKLTKYLLNPEHPKGGSKADWLERSIGLSLEDWPFLLEQLREQVALVPPTNLRPHEHGVNFRLPMTLRGRDGRRTEAITVWTAREMGRPHFTTAIPAP